MRRFALPLMLLLCAIVVFLLAYPLWVTQPFKHQDAADLQRALAVLRIAPWTAAALALGALITLVAAWRGLRLGSRILGTLFCLIACGAALLTRVNVFELMFHPVSDPRFIKASDGKLDRSDMLIAVFIAGEARAYPIRAMGYHHVVNDRVGGVPIVATY